MQGTSFAFIPIMIPLVAGKGVDGLAALYGGVIVGGLFHAALGIFIGRIRFALPPLVTGLVVTMIGLALVRVGIQYAAGGVPAIGTPEYGSLLNWSAALVVIIVTLALKFYAPGMLSLSAVLIGLVAGYVYAIVTGMLPLASIGSSWTDAAAFALPSPFRYGVDFTIAAALGFCLMAIISAIETVGDVSGITKGRRRSRGDRGKEISGATWADGHGYGDRRYLRFGLPNTSFSPERRTGRDDRRHDEPSCRHDRSDLPDPLRTRSRRSACPDLARSRLKCWAAA